MFFPLCMMIMAGAAPSLQALSASFLCGIDEAGRGCLAGPVCAAAAILTDEFDASILNDSKKLTPKKREAAAKAIYRGASAWGIGWASNEEIDRVNILNATLLAMARAFEAAAAMLAERMALSLPQARVFINVIVDGIHAPNLECASISTKIRADASVHEVMAASILAKTARDELMRGYAKIYPGYGYEKHKGYPTREHTAAIARLGPSPIQRMTFRHG